METQLGLEIVLDVLDVLAGAIWCLRSGGTTYATCTTCATCAAWRADRLFALGSQTSRAFSAQKGKAMAGRSYSPGQVLQLTTWLAPLLPVGPQTAPVGRGTQWQEGRLLSETIEELYIE